MKLVYVAGKMRANSIWEYTQNVRIAEEVMIRWMRAGCAVICPHKNGSHLDGVFDEGSGLLGDLPDVADDFWLQADFEIIRRCDAIVMIEGWEDSKGATAEHNFAEENGIPILYDKYFTSHHVIEDLV